MDDGRARAMQTAKCWEQSRLLLHTRVPEPGLHCLPPAAWPQDISLHSQSCFFFSRLSPLRAQKIVFYPAVKYLLSQVKLLLPSLSEVLAFNA